MKERSLPFPLRLPLIKEHSRLHSARYYDHPDGVDLVGKLIGVNRMIYPACFAHGVLGFVQEPSQSLGAAFIRGLQYSLPGFICANAFVTTTFLSTYLRGKDDYLNYQIGAVAAATALGATQKSFLLGCGLSVFFGKWRRSQIL